MADITYTNLTQLLVDGAVDWDNGGQTYRVLLTTTSYTPDQDAHIFVSSVTNELSGGNYVRKDLVNRSTVKDNANNRTNLLADCPVWANFTGTFRWAVVYKFVTSDADSPVLRAIDLTAVTATAADFKLRFDSQETSGTVFRIAI